MKIKSFIFSLLVIVLLASFFSYRLLEVPAGLTVDEAAFGYNAVLLSRTGYDENGRFMPAFVLSIDGRDWRQPVTQYFLTGWFKVFGPSVWGLRFTSVVIAVGSAVLLFFLSFGIFRVHHFETNNDKFAKPSTGLTRNSLWVSGLATLIFLTTPLLMIQAHMGLDNIYVIPFTILWLTGLFMFQSFEASKLQCFETKRWVWLVLAGVSLGIGFYSYKGMRAVVPVWVVLTVLYLLFLEKKDGRGRRTDFEGGVFNWRRFISKIQTSKNQFPSFVFRYLSSPIVFLSSLLPFFAIIPWLEKHYAGAVLGGSNPEIVNVYDFLYPYLSSFDWTFLFVKGDELLFHSTRMHGMFLLSSLPFWLLGVYAVLKKKYEWGIFVLLAFFTAPLLYGMVGSVHRASRLMMLIPLYALLCGYGIEYLWSWKNRILKFGFGGLIAVLMMANYADFVNYYWFTYPKFTENIFGHLELYKAYEELAKESGHRGLVPYLLGEPISKGSEEFFERVYFEEPIGRIHEGDLPVDGVVLSIREILPGMERVGEKVGGEYYMHVRK